MAVPKWKINGLNGKFSFRKTALIILIERSNNLKRLISKFLTDETPEALHDIRISLRRLRYNMELFYDLFEKKKFLQLYNMVEIIQDKTGNVRDTYILKQNILLFKKENDIIIPDNLSVRIEEKEKLLYDDLRIELYYFLHSPELKNFIKLLKKKETI